MCCHNKIIPFNNGKKRPLGPPQFRPDGHPTWSECRGIPILLSMPPGVIRFTIKPDRSSIYVILSNECLLLTPLTWKRPWFPRGVFVNIYIKLFQKIFLQVLNGCNSNSKSKRHRRWLVLGSSTYYLYAFVASILAALMSSLI